MNVDIKVIVAAHRPCAVATDPLYLPLQVGAANNTPIGLRRDDDGDNISNKNPYFSELTGLYWAWKNLPGDYIGLVHYRRYFAEGARWFGRRKQPFRHVLTLEGAQKRLAGRDGLLPRRRHYVIDTLYNHYRHTCYVEPLDETGRILEEKYPAYVPAFRRLRHRRSAHMFNMFILRRDHLDAYCTWLFDVLFTLEQRIDATQYTPYQARFFGRVSELLLDVWLEQNPLNCASLPVAYIGPVHWGKKCAAFLAAKFLGKKYEHIF